MYQYSNNPYMYHHGIKGMKWGVRRYQNKDGTLTEAGKKKYKANASDSTVTKRVKKDLSEMTGEDFKRKYQVSNTRYMKRVDKYIDPYMNSPLAKFGKKKEEQARIKRGKAKAKSIIEEYGDKYPVTVDEKGYMSIKIGDDIWKIGY